MLGFDKDVKGEEYRLKLLRYFSPFESAGEPSPSHIYSFRMANRQPQVLITFTNGLMAALKNSGAVIETEHSRNEGQHSITFKGSSNAIIFSIPKDLHSLQLFNDAYLATGKHLRIFSEDLSFQRPLTKDFNDDLKLYHQIVQREKAGFNYQGLRLNYTSYITQGQEFTPVPLQRLHLHRIG